MSSYMYMYSLWSYLWSVNPDNTSYCGCGLLRYLHFLHMCMHNWVVHFVAYTYEGNVENGDLFYCTIKSGANINKQKLCLLLGTFI